MISFEKSIVDRRQLVEELQRRLGPAWARMVAWLRDNNALGQVEARIARGDFDGALGGIMDAATWFASEVGAAKNYAARNASRWLTGELDELVNFDESNWQAVRAMQTSRTDLIREVSQGQQATVRTIVTDGISRGENPRAIARDVRWSVGLTEHQANIVLNFRRELETGQWSRANARELIDGRWTRTFQRLMRDGGSLTPMQVTAMVNKYSDNWVAFRSTNIARTEGLRAAHTGSHATYAQAIERGTIDAEDIVRTWRHGPNRKHSREGHVRMNGQERAWGEAFTNPVTGVNLAYPCDPDAPASETNSCTCIEVVRIRRQR